MTTKKKKSPFARKFWAAVIDPVIGIENQPIGKVEWVDRNTLTANSYNPNNVASPEMRLLKISIMSDGWTQPIVARRSGEIVDGFHRWTTSGDAEVSAMTGGMVPVVFLSDETSEEHQKMSTIRHNRARGSHHVVKMADIVVDLAQQGMKNFDIAEKLQMELEEVERLLDHGSMTKRYGETRFGNGWTVRPNKSAPKLTHEAPTPDETDGGTRY